MSVNRRDFIKLSTTAALGAVSAPSWGAATPLNTHRPDEFIDYDALGLAQLIKNKEVSPAELVDVVIRRIEAVNPIINCISTPTFDRAKMKAPTFSADSKFAGVPSLIKDMIDIGGVRRTDGS